MKVRRAEKIPNSKTVRTEFTARVTFGFWNLFGFWILGFGFSASGVAQPFQLPTANHALFEKSGEEKFFVGTAGKPWQSGMFGCVRSDGHQIGRASCRERV